MLKKLFSKEPEPTKQVTSADARSGRFTITVTDDEGRTARTFQGCTHVKAGYYELEFTDSMGLWHKEMGFDYFIQEEI